MTSTNNAIFSFVAPMTKPTTGLVDVPLDENKSSDNVASSNASSNASSIAPSTVTTWNMRPAVLQSRTAIKDTDPETVNGCAANVKIQKALLAAEREGPMSGDEAREVLTYLYRMGGDPAVEKQLLERLVGMIEHLESQVKVARDQPTNNKPLKLDMLRAHPFVTLSQAYLRTWGSAYDFERFLSQKHKLYFSVNEQLRAYMKSVMRECTLPDHRREFLWDEFNHYFQQAPNPVTPSKPAPMLASEFVHGINFDKREIEEREF